MSETSWQDTIRYNGPDHMRTQNAAAMLAYRVNHYWRQRGVDANARAEKQKYLSDGVWVVRSDLNGSEA